MANKQLLLPGEIVKKHNTLVRSKININGLTSSRLWACLIASIRKDDTEFKEAYGVPIKNYLQDESGRVYKHAKEACRELGQATFEREWPQKGTSEPIFEVVPFFMSVKYQNGIIEAKFNPTMKNELLQLQQFFTEYDLMEYLSLPSVYSQRIFEILKSYASLDEWTIPLEDLHRMLNTPVSFRADFKALRIRVLEKAHKDILKYTNFEYEWEPIKQGRGIVAVRFVFNKKRKKAIETEKQQAKTKKQSESNNKLFLSVMTCRRERGLKDNEKCDNPTCSASKKAVCLEVFSD